MEANGLLTRRCDHTNRRAHVLELTEAGRRAFALLAEAAAAYDRRLLSSA